MTTEKDRYAATVVKIIDNYKLVCNIGADQGVKLGQEFKVIGVGDEIVDPESSESLGRLEIVRGVGKVTHVQPKMSTIESSRWESSPQKREIEKTSHSYSGTSIYSSFALGITPKEVTKETIVPGESSLLPFDEAVVGDRLLHVKSR